MFNVLEHFVQCFRAFRQLYGRERSTKTRRIFIDINISGTETNKQLYGVDYDEASLSQTQSESFPQPTQRTLLETVLQIWFAFKTKLFLTEHFHLIIRGLLHTPYFVLIGLVMPKLRDSTLYFT